MRYLSVVNPLTMMFIYFVVAPALTGYKKIKCAIHPNCPECAVN
ncbi:hypothetical protein [Desulforamulus ruminis]|uniref:Uncharacterized protein n=1 Tax=Desulforamulus ruminis (strain ATCC 23193 / DSM 2154 / NCIMB 8452 / DL) TaxID=696281 RepID=F6DQE7_DESRL|nr:hypothetical protein [Desulforamulus ruminis]AEG60841.1 hypothetical protein Desru_2614 [Desulforamulus ruminis DSM 2154]